MDTIIKRMIQLIKNIIKPLIKPYRPILGLFKLKISDIKRTWWYQYFPVKPKVINLNANDICNSGCTMCNIWKRSKEFEFSPNELETILSNPLYSEVKHVGITGGEPTLREDLPQLFEKVVKTLPSIVGVSMITNGINADHIFNQIIQINQICAENNTNFGVMVSLDGVGITHDLVRGKEGNFASSEHLIKRIKTETNISLSTGCTITKTNVWKVDNLLDYLKENNIYGRFRVAEYIKRLYNEPNKTAIRNFTPDESYHLQLFFHKLKHTYEKNGDVQRTYSSIINMLGGGKRQIGCPYHTEGLVLDSRGDMAYCAPKSKIIGNSLNISALKLWRNNLNERRRIIKHDCNQCIHDYHASLTYNEAKVNLINLYSGSLLQNHYNKIRYLRKLALPFSKPPKKHTVFIVGWYGTETIGDKAILGGIINYYNERYSNNCSFIIGSLFPFITEKTVKEMGVNAKVVDSTKLELIKYSAKAHETVMGGGPLMDLNVLYVPYIAFYTAQRFNKTTTIFGCGIGPLKTHQDTVKSILKLSTNIKVRDNESQKIAQEWTKRNDIEMLGDPAKKYIKAITPKINTETKKNELACFLREWTHEYAPELTKTEFDAKKVLFEQTIAAQIKSLIADFDIEKVRLYHMHNFHVGNDDRDFSRRFIKNYFPGDRRISFDEKLSTIESIINAMKSSKLNLCMRFHSVLFADTLNTDFKVIDYTLGGKIYKYLTDNNRLDSIIHFDEFQNENTPHQHIR